VASFDGDSVTRVPVSGGDPVTTYAGTDGAHGVAFDGSYIWITNRDQGTVTKLSPADGSVAGGPCTVGSKPSWVTFDGKYIWVSNSVNVRATEYTVGQQQRDAAEGERWWACRHLRGGGLAIRDGVRRRERLGGELVG